jgi:hypothetical protein
MADYCDWDPCAFLQKLILDLMPNDRGADTVQVLTLGQSKGSPLSLKRVTLYYCPFCGTRLHGNKEILSWAYRKRGAS